MKNKAILAVVAFAISTTLFAKVTLPTVFTNNMVLQQSSDVAIWGWGNAGETIKIVASWNPTDTVAVKVDNKAQWHTSIKTIEAGGPYKLQFMGSSYEEVSSVMLGEVWICSGQSNMEWSVNNKIHNGEEEAANATNPNIRIYHMPKIGADYPQQNSPTNWTVCSPQTMRSTSAVGYFFARELQQKLNVPIGIIVTAWGGTPAEVWIEKSKIDNNPILSKSKYNETFQWWPGSPGILYNSMIYPVIPYGIAGAIWYQGESNCGNHKIYGQLMQTLIENWRSDFGKDFPFYIVQIAPYAYGDNGTSEFVREQQQWVAKNIPNTGMVVVSDLVDDVKDIHPRNKLDVGKRLANYALAETYKQNIGAYKSPSYQSMKVEQGNIYITINDAPTGLKTTGKAATGFLIAGDDKVFVSANAKIKGSTIVLSSKQVKAPVAVRFCFDDTSMPDVYSNEGLPLAPFRTDNWDK